MVSDLGFFEGVCASIGLVVTLLIALPVAFAICTIRDTRKRCPDEG